jgi:hypothetical protein
MRERLYIVCTSMFDYRKRWSGFCHRVGTIGVNNWEWTYPKNLCEMAVCYRLHTTVEFCAIVAGELLIFLSHMSPDNFTSKRPVEPHEINEGVFCGSSPHCCWILVSVYALTLRCCEENWGCFMLLILSFVIFVHNRHSAWLQHIKLLLVNHLKVEWFYSTHDTGNPWRFSTSSRWLWGPQGIT